MFNIFDKITFKGKKNYGRKQHLKDSVKANVIKKVEPERAETDTVEPERFNPFEMRYRDNNTGEIHTFDTRDFETFDKIMSRKDVTLIFG